MPLSNKELIQIALDLEEARRELKEYLASTKEEQDRMVAMLNSKVEELLDGVYQTSLIVDDARTLGFSELGPEHKTVVDAYSDANELSKKERDLGFRSELKLSLFDWEWLMLMAVPGNYNEFTAQHVARAFRDAVSVADVQHLMLTPGRESSPVVYVSGPTDLLQQVYAYFKKHRIADELDWSQTFNSSNYPDEGLRIWWD